MIKVNESIRISSDIFNSSIQIIDLIDSFYKLKLLKTMHIHDVFHSKLLRLVINDSLSDQKNEFSRSIVINDEDK